MESVFTPFLMLLISQDIKYRYNKFNLNIKSYCKNQKMWKLAELQLLHIYITCIFNHRPWARRVCSDEVAICFQRGGLEEDRFARFFKIAKIDFLNTSVPPLWI